MAKNSKMVEVVFKGERRSIYRNRQELDLQRGDYVLVEADRGNDLGMVSLVGNLVRLKRGKGEAKGIIRVASPDDIAIRDQNRQKERDAFRTCKEKIKQHGLEMKLVDCEMQFDGSKLTFYFTAAQRIDFRELVKELASLYRTRIELRQIGVRDEAKRIGGFGICGKVQCCSSFLTEFEQITTQMAKDQQLSLNPSKISGNCGRLLCCLNYESGEYLKVFKEFPALGSPVTVDGKTGTLTYINVFKVKGLVRYHDGGGDDWLTPEEMSKGHKQNVKQEA